MSQLYDPQTDNPVLIPPVHSRIETYLRELAHPHLEAVPLEMEALAEKRRFPIVGPLVGQFLEVMARTVDARRVFEFGSGFGYSAYWFARGLPADGLVICTDTELESARLAEGFLSRAGLWGNVEYRLGMAQDLFEAAEGEFDICYNDVDKGDYPAVWRLAKDRIRPGGLYIADNVLWHGRVAMEAHEDVQDVVAGWTEAVREHNAAIFNDPDFDCCINPVRDGVIVARRKNL